MTGRNHRSTRSGTRSVSTASAWKSWLKNGAIGASAAMLVFACAPAARSDVFVGGRQVGGGSDSADSEKLTSVSVKDSPEAMAKLETARSMERQHDWNKAAGWYQEILEQYRDRVVPSHTNAKGMTDQYTSIVDQVQEALARWPADGLAAYNARYGAAASNLLDQAKADDADALAKIVHTYFVTDAAKVAGIRLIDLYMEQGDFAAAAWMGDRLLQWHPNLKGADRARVLYRTGLAYHLSGETATAEQKLGDLKKESPDAKDTIFGQEQPLATLLEEQLAQAPPVATASDDGWPTFGGDQRRSRVLEGGGVASARLFSVKLPGASAGHHNGGRGRAGQRFNGAPQQQMIDASGMPIQTGPGQNVGIFPVLDRDELFFQDGTRVWGLDVRTGLPLPGWMSRYGRDGYFTLQGARGTRTVPATLTLAGNNVLGVMAQQPSMNWQQRMNGQPMPQNSQLVCLDRQTGALKWAVKSSELKDDLAGVEFVGTPVVVGDNVFVTARGAKTADFEECYLVCLDLNKGMSTGGKPRWQTFIASASSGMTYGRMPDRGVGIGQLAYNSGRLYVLSNLGVLAAVDAYSGSIVWLSLYPREDLYGMGPGGFQPDAMSRGNEPWEVNPVMEQDGKLFCIPTDGRDILVYEAGNGQLVKRIPRSGSGAFPADVLLAVDGPLMYLEQGSSDFRNQGSIDNSPGIITCIKWNEYDPKNHLACLKYRSTATDTVIGRGSVTRVGTTVTNQKRLEVVAAKSGRLLSDGEYPPHTSWDPSEEGPGNVLVTSQYVVVAGSDFVDVYTSMNAACSELDKREAANPNDVLTRLSYAKMLAAAGKNEEMFAKFDEAAGILGGWDSLRTGDDRSSLHGLALGLAEKFGHDLTTLVKTDSVHPSMLNLKPVEKLFDLATKAAASPSEQVNARFSHASFAQSVGDLAAASAYNQQILMHPDWRTVAVRSDDGKGARQAGAIAEENIAGLIAKDRTGQCYAAFEQQAADALAQAQASHDADRLLEIARSYPNSKSAPTALISAGDCYQDSGRPILAAQVVRQAYLRYFDPSDAANIGTSPHLATNAHVLEALVRTYLDRPGRLEIAIDRLQMAITPTKAVPDPALASEHFAQDLTLPDGQVLSKPTFEEAYRAISHLHDSHAVAQLPDPHIPAPQLHDVQARPLQPDDEQARLGDVLALLAPPVELRNFNRPDRVTVWRNNELQVFASGEAGPAAKPVAIVSAKDMTSPPTAIAWLRAPEPAAVPATQHAATQVNSQVASGTQPATGPMVAPECLLAWSAGDLVFYDTKNAKLLWRFGTKQVPTIDVVQTQDTSDQTADAADPDVANGPGNMQVLIQNNRRIVIRNGVVISNRPLNGGNNADQNEMAVVPMDKEEIQFVRPNADSVIVATNTGRIFSIEQATGKLNWQTRMTNHAYEQVLVSPDFVAARFTDEQAGRILVIDTLDGHLLSQQGYPHEMGSEPVNMALSSDGLLVWTLPDRILAADLYRAAPELKDRLKFDAPADEMTSDTNADINRRRQMRGGGMMQLFAQCGGPDQLLIADNRILTLQSAGRYFTIRSTDTGRVYPAAGAPKLRDFPGYPVGASTSSAIVDGHVVAQLRVEGGWVYAVGDNTFIGYGLDDPSKKTWPSSPSTDHILDVQPLAGVVVQITAPANEVGDRHNPVTPSNKIVFYSRMLTSGGRESGKQLFKPTVVNNGAGIVSWQITDGGFYYYTSDHVLHFMKGLR